MMMLNGLAWWDGRYRERIEEECVYVFLFLPAPCTSDGPLSSYSTTPSPGGQKG